MKKRLNPNWFPNYEQKSVVDRYMGMLDCHGLSRRKFLALASCSAVASATAASFGIPAVAVADEGGKIAHLIMTQRLEYCVNADAGARQAAQALGMTAASVDGQLDSERQLDQFQQQLAAGVKGVMLHAPGGGSIKRIAQLANENKVYLDNTWGTLPWFTPFDAGDYYTMYAVPEEFSAERGVTEAVCKAVMDKFGGGDVVGVTGVEGNSTDLIRSRGRDDAIKSFPEDQACRRTARKVESRRFAEGDGGPDCAPSQDRRRHCPERRRGRRLHGGIARGDHPARQ